MKSNLSRRIIPYRKSHALVRLLDFMCLALWILITQRRKWMVSRARPNVHQTLMANVLTFRATARERERKREERGTSKRGCVIQNDRVYTQYSYRVVAVIFFSTRDL
uniref:Secreted protein n=1 Tax=Trichogramma kaykai TaxID=54128 RepID=A0ABD2WKW1_9HYME